FLWAKLVLDNICILGRLSLIRDEVSKTPRKLHGTIQRVIMRLEESEGGDYQDLNKIISWVACARRPLELNELHAILKMPSGEPYLTLEDDLQGVWATLFSLRKQLYEVKVGSFSTVTFAHKAIKDYFVRSNFKPDSFTIGMNVNNSEFEIAMTL